MLCKAFKPIASLVFCYSLTALAELQAYDLSMPEPDGKPAVGLADAPMSNDSDLGLFRASRIQEAVRATTITHDYPKAVEIFDTDLWDRKQGWVQDWLIAAVAHAHLGHTDRAFEYLDQAVERGLELDPKSVEESLIRYKAKPHLENDPRYPKFLESLMQKRAEWIGDLDPVRWGVASPNAHKLSELRQLSQGPDEEIDPHEIVRELSEFSDYPEPLRKDQWVKYEHFAKEKLLAPYYVYIPPKYDPRKQTGMIVYLHGDAPTRSKFPKAESKTFISDNPYLEFARENNLLMLCPAGMRDMNWWEPLGMNTVLGELYSVKKIFNVDDNAVWLSGHSAGGTGVFGVAVTAPTAFAGFYPLNGTPLPNRFVNLRYRPIYSTFSSKDPKTPIDQMQTHWQAACKHNADWTFRELLGHSHSYFSYIEKELASLTTHMLQTKRPSLQPRIEWESTPHFYSGCEWLRVERVTSSRKPAQWHDASSNPLSTLFGAKQEPASTSSPSIEIGRIRGVSESNTFRIETSQVGEFSIRLSPQMVDFNYPVKVYVNDELVRDEIVQMDADVMLNLFEAEADKQRVWGNVLRIVIPS
jgi:hypothetical protein